MTTSTASAAPSEPVIFEPSVGNSWVLHSWSEGIGGDVTDSYKIYYDNYWHDVTDTTYNDTGLAPHSTSTITIVAYNASNDISSASVTSTAQLPNNPISITGVSSFVPATTGQTVSVTPGYNDADGDTPTFSCSRTDLFTDFNPATGAGTWTPSAVGIYSIDFSVDDGYGSSDTQTMMVTVTASLSTDTAPVLSPIGDKSVVEGNLLRFTVSATDAEGDTIRYSANHLPVGATLNPNTGLFSWTPGTGTAGSYDVEFIATANGRTDSETVIITVTGEDHAPVLSPIGDKSANEATLLTFTIQAVDDDGDAITYTASALPAGATLGSTNGVFSWTPDYNSAGRYNVQFIATANGVSDSETITITINNVDTPPVLAVIGNKAVEENQLLTFTVSATDADGDAISYSASSLPLGATLNPNTGVFSWTPGYNTSGNYHVGFAATSNSLSDSENITITVGNYDQPPVLTPIGSKTVEEEHELTFTVSATDPDPGANLTYSARNLPDSAIFNSSTRVFSWTPEDGDKGTYNVMFLVSDGIEEDSENVAISVTTPSSGSSSGSSAGGSGSSSGGGGGGSSSGSSEDYENIAFKDYVLKTAVTNDRDIVFSFKKEDNNIISINLRTSTNGKQTKAVVEMLHDTSSQVSTDAPGNVYQNMNIYLDTNIPVTSLNDIKINFKVDKDWINQHNIDVSNIVLCRYHNNEWQQLLTEMDNDDSGYYYFTSESPGFSPFAISSIDPSMAEKGSISISQPGDGVLASTADSIGELTKNPTAKSVSSVGFVLVMLLAGIGVIYWALRME